MSMIKTLCGYNVTRASAVQQRKLMMILGAHLAYVSAKSGEIISTSMLKGALLTIGEENIAEISNIILWKTVKNGGNELVTIENFDGGMNLYFTLLAEGIHFNLADFIFWLDGELDVRAKETQAEAALTGS